MSRRFTPGIVLTIVAMLVIALGVPQLVDQFGLLQLTVFGAMCILALSLGFPAFAQEVKQPPKEGATPEQIKDLGFDPFDQSGVKLEEAPPKDWQVQQAPPPGSPMPTPGVRPMR